MQRWWVDSNFLYVAIFCFLLISGSCWGGSSGVCASSKHRFLVYPCKSKHWAFHPPQNITPFQRFQSCLVKDTTREFSSALSKCSTTKYLVVDIQILYQLVRGEKVVTKYATPVPLYWCTQLGDNWVAQAMLDTLLRLSSVDVEVTQVAIGAVCPTPHLYAPLDWFHGQVLLASSTASHSEDDNSPLKFVFKSLRNWRTLKSLSKFSSSGLGIFELSDKCRLLQKSRNLFLGMMLA